VTAPPGYAPPHRLRDAFSGPQVRVGLLAAAALLVEALLAKTVLDLQLNFFAQPRCIVDLRRLQAERPARPAH
jgi:hypothetical protein